TTSTRPAAASTNERTAAAPPAGIGSAPDEAPAARTRPAMAAPAIRRQTAGLIGETDLPAGRPWPPVRFREGVIQRDSRLPAWTLMPWARIPQRRIPPPTGPACPSPP